MARKSAGEIASDRDWPEALSPGGRVARALGWGENAASGPIGSITEDARPNVVERAALDPARCLDCGADLRAVGIIENEPVWMLYRWYPRTDGGAGWAPGEGVDGEEVGHIGGMDSDWRCGACGKLVPSPDALEGGG